MAKLVKRLWPRQCCDAPFQIPVSMSSIVNEKLPLRSGSGLKTSLPGVRIVATGSYVPEVVVHNSDLARLGCDEQWIVQRTGILQRRHCAPDQSTADLAFLAGRDCLERAGMAAGDLDLIIVCTMTPDHFTPSTSAIVQQLLQCEAVGMDVNAACSGFMYGLVVAGQFVTTGSYRNVLVIGADAMSRVIDPQDPRTYPLFGDAAGAALVTLDPEAAEESRGGIRAWRMGTAGELGHLITVPGGGARMPASETSVRDREHFLKMNGKPVFKWAVRMIPAAVQEALDLAGMDFSDMDQILLHQANRRIIDAALETMPVDRSKVPVNLQNYGNTSAASIPLLLDESLKAKTASLEGRILMCGFGAGLTWGSCIYEGIAAD